MATSIKERPSSPNTVVAFPDREVGHDTLQKPETDFHIFFDQFRQSDVYRRGFEEFARARPNPARFRRYKPENQAGFFEEFGREALVALEQFERSNPFIFGGDYPPGVSEAVEGLAQEFIDRRWGEPLTTTLLSKETDVSRFLVDMKLVPTVPLARALLGLAMAGSDTIGRRIATTPFSQQLEFAVAAENLALAG